MQASVKVIDDVIERQTPSGPGWYRYGFTNSGNYSEDGYGDCFDPGTDPTNCSPTGAPWPPTDTGTGHLWPVLSGERGEYEIAAGDPSFAGQLLTSMRNMTSGQGLEPEQAWEDPDLAASPYGSDPATASIGFTDGKPAGSASPLTWAQAAYARLALDLSAGRDLETPQIVTDRYVRHGMPGTVPITISTPSTGTRVNTATVTVSGTTTPGATVVVEAAPPTGGSTVGIASTTPDSSGNWSVSVPVGIGTTVITATATLGRSTGYAQSSVVNFTLPGATVLNDTDPTGDDNGPGTYQYPTASAFAPGSFDLTDLHVSQTGTYVYVQVRIRNLVSTFGNSFGAQLLDIYVRNPAASSFSTAGAYPQLNYGIASGSGWSERLEAQGFASPIWVNPSGGSLGNPEFVVDDTSGTATLILPESTFGAVTPSWVFTVALTGQNGFNSYQARDFTPTPGAYTFGVCAPGGTAPICTFPASNVPYVMDTITPPGVSQSTELNPTLGPVELQGVNGSDTQSGP